MSRFFFSPRPLFAFSLHAFLASPPLVPPKSLSIFHLRLLSHPLPIIRSIDPYAKHILILRFCWAGGAPQAQTQHLERPSFERRSHSTTSLDAYFQQPSTSHVGTPHGERPGSGSYFSTTQPTTSSSHSHSHSMSSTPSGSYFSAYSTSTQGEPSQGSSSSGDSAIGLDFGGKGGGGLELNTRGTMSPSITMSPPVVY